MRLKEFIIIEQIQSNEASSEVDFTIKGLSDEQWAAWVEQNCSDYLPRAGRYPIYRGFKDKTVELGVKDTNEFARSSVGAANYLTLWVDNAVQWQDYPKRSKSFIGTSYFYIAYDFGKVYRLFPANDAKIGICPKSDFGSSFGEVPGGSHLRHFVHLLEDTFKKIYGNAAAERAAVNWAELKRLLELTDFSKFIEINKNYIFNYDQFAQMNYSKLIDYFEDEIAPEKHGFQHVTPANYSVKPASNREIWVQGKVALARSSSIFNSINSHRLFPRITELFSRYNIK